VESGTELKKGGDAARNNDRTRIRWTKTAEQRQKCALSSSVGSDHAYGLPLSNSEGHIAQGDESVLLASKKARQMIPE
jgi:hypothetical protein